MVFVSKILISSHSFFLVHLFGSLSPFLILFLFYFLK